MKTLLYAALTSALLTAPAALSQQPPEPADPRRAEDRTTDRDPRVGAQVQTAAGEPVGTVARIEFETENRAVAAGYVVTLTSPAGVPQEQVFIDAEDAVWTDLAATPVLQLSPDAADPRLEPGGDIGAQMETGITLDPGPEPDALLANPDAASRDVREPQTLMTPDETTALIEWDFQLDAGGLTLADWDTMTAYTPDGDPFGVVTDVRIEDDEPAQLVVQTLPEFYDLGVLLVFDITDVEAVSQSRSAFRIDPAKGDQA